MPANNLLLGVMHDWECEVIHVTNVGQVLLQLHCAEIIRAADNQGLDTSGYCPKFVVMPESLRYLNLVLQSIWSYSFMSHVAAVDCAKHSLTPQCPYHLITAD